MSCRGVAVFAVLLAVCERYVLMLLVLNSVVVCMLLLCGALFV